MSRKYEYYDIWLCFVLTLFWSTVKRFWYIKKEFSQIKKVRVYLRSHRNEAHVTTAPAALAHVFTRRGGHGWKSGLKQPVHAANVLPKMLEFVSETSKRRCKHLPWNEVKWSEMRVDQNKIYWIVKVKPKISATRRSAVKTNAFTIKHTCDLLPVLWIVSPWRFCHMQPLSQHAYQVVPNKGRCADNHVPEQYLKGKMMEWEVRLFEIIIFHNYCVPTYDSSRNNHPISKICQNIAQENYIAIITNLVR